MVKIQGASLPQHPLQIKPSGNAFLQKSAPNIGQLSRLTDDLLLMVLGYLEGNELQMLSATCRELQAFIDFDEIWKTLLVERGSSQPWRGTWRETYLGRPVTRCIAPNMCSDALYRPFLYASTDFSALLSFAKFNIPKMDDMKLEDFESLWYRKPFILTQPVRKWKAFKKWNMEELRCRYGKVSFRAEAVDWPLEVYVEYMRNNADESPLYLFDKDFTDKTLLSSECSIPETFDHDYFRVLYADRPDHAWLIIGPKRSGSTFHKDPNATSAWNAVINGKKFWIMLPPKVDPPGVYVSADESEVTSPLSIAEWFLGFYEECCHVEGCIQGICEAGEVVYVPAGWFHLVVNLEETIAVTQNFVPRSCLSSVLSFLRDRPEQVSGFPKHIKDPYRLFVERMKIHYPKVPLDVVRKRKWEDITTGDTNGNSFSFNFGD